MGGRKKKKEMEKRKRDKSSIGNIITRYVKSILWGRKLWPERVTEHIIFTIVARIQAIENENVVEGRWMAKDDRSRRAGVKYFV